MKKMFFIFLFVFASAVSFAEVSIIPKDAPQEMAGFPDFRNLSYTFNIRVNDKVSGQCRAARVHRNWFLTAAHCLLEKGCDKGCAVELLIYWDQDYSVRAVLKHTPETPVLFWDKEYQDSSYERAYGARDIAAIKYIPPPAHDLKVGFLNNAAVKKEMENPFIQEKALKASLSFKKVPLLSFKDKNYKMDREFAIYKAELASPAEGKSMLYSPGPFYFVQKNRNLAANNFGLVPGVSGAGLMTNKGELAGIVRAVEPESPRTSVARPGAPPPPPAVNAPPPPSSSVKRVGIGSIKGSVFFTTFNDGTLAFLKKTMGPAYNTLEIVDAEDAGATYNISANNIPSEFTR